jgi:DNA-binding NarL/FixJ family response regulator
MIRIFIADDQHLMRQGFRMILESQEDLKVVGEAGDGLQALAGIEATQPDVVLMDIRMPALDGIEATRRVQGPKVVILTTFGSDDYVVDALRAGASGFILKDASPDQLIDAVRVVAAGDCLLSPAVTTRLIARALPGLGPSAGPPAALGLLTPRELEVLRQLARGLSNAEIAEAMFLSEATVKSHVSHVLAKLGLRDRVQAVVVAFDSGLVVPGRS